MNGATTIRTLYEGFSYEQPVTCGDKKQGRFMALYNGEQSRSQNGAESQDFTINLRLQASGLDKTSCTEGPHDLAWEYRGTILGSESLTEGKHVWNGSGRIGSAQEGVVAVETKDEVLDSAVCGDEALSGNTTLQAGGHQAVLQYDGAVDCQETATAKWSVDGAAPITLEGVSCSAATASALPFWGVLGALGWLRRRVRRAA